MANKNIQFKDNNGNYLYPVTKLSNVSITLGNAISSSGDTLGCDIAVAGTTQTAVLGVVKPNSDHISVDSGGFMDVLSATESRQGIVELATTTEATIGTNTTKAVTPAGLAAAISGATVTINQGTGITITANNTINANIAVAGTTNTASAGIIKPNSDQFSTDANGFLSAKLTCEII